MQVLNLNKEGLGNAVQVAQENDISIYYEIAYPEPQIVSLYFKTSRYAQFNLKLDEIKTLLSKESVELGQQTCFKEQLTCSICSGEFSCE